MNLLAFDGHRIFVDSVDKFVMLLYVGREFRIVLHVHHSLHSNHTQLALPCSDWELRLFPQEPEEEEEDFA